MVKEVENALKAACIISGHQFSRVLLKVWEIGLEDYTEEEIKDATNQYCKDTETREMPTPKVFISFRNSKKK